MDRGIAMGKLEGPLSVRPMLVQPIGAIYKPDADKWRNVVDSTATGLNAACQDIPVAYDTVIEAVQALYPGAWMGTMDLKDAFQHFAITGQEIVTCWASDTLAPANFSAGASYHLGSSRRPGRAKQSLRRCAMHCGA